MLSQLEIETINLQPLALLASEICNSARAVISLLDSNELWILSSYNFPETALPLLQSIFNHSQIEKKIFEAEDIATDPRFKLDSLILRQLNLASFLVAPLRTKSGVPLGLLIVFDSRVKKLTIAQKLQIEIVAQQIAFVLEAKKVLKESENIIKKLEESQKYQKAVIENVPSLIYIKNAKDGMAYSLMNPACEKIFGVTEEQVIGKKDSDFLPLALAEHLSISDQKAFSRLEVTRTDRVELPTAIGKRFFTVYKVPLFDEENQPQMLIVIMRDITEKLQAQTDLEFERMKTIHTAKLATLGEISAGIAHEINNPLTIISGAALLLSKLKDDPVEFLEKSKKIFKSVDRIAKIINNLKKFSRYNEKPVFDFFKLSDIVLEALEMVETKSRLLDVEIRTKNLSQSIIYCGQLEIEQVIINLVNNSMDAIRNLPTKWVEVTSFETPQQVVLRIQDSGPGIPIEIEKKLFDPFFTTKPLGEGTGLGLSISKDILKQHGASIHLNREIENTCFDISFPKNLSENSGLK